MKSLDGQVIIVTGASAGIGEATARRLAGAGALVVLVARRAERLEHLSGEIERAGGRAVAVAADVTSAEDRARLVAEALKVSGRIDALVNNAGFGQRGPIELVPVENIRQNFELNLFSLIALTQLVIPLMRARGAGRIVNVGSVAGRVARPLSSVYDATKHALEAVSDGLRGELAPFGVQVVLIEPGFILTEFRQVANDVSRAVTEDAGPYAPFLAAFEAGYERSRRYAGRPDDIARLIERALIAERPHARYAGPLHARVAIALKRFLPERLFEYVLNRQSGVGKLEKK
ncbi:MAG: SDR family NAD(P)-dependent oxidoreductase [Pyrinomonadaceae bacterium]